METNNNQNINQQNKRYSCLNANEKQKVLVPSNENNPLEDISHNIYTKNVICCIISTPFQFTGTTPLNPDEIYIGKIVGYSVKNVFLTDGQAVVYITLKCELYSNDFGGFIAPHKISANLTSHSNLTNLLQCLDISISDKKTIKLDDLIGTKVACTVRLENDYWVVNTITGR